HRADALDEIAGPMPLLDDFLDCNTSLAEIGLVSLDPIETGAAEGGDCRERLADLVSDRGGQFACRGKPVHLRKFVQPLQRLGLGKTAAPMFIKKPRNQQRLQQQCGADHQDLLAITLERARLTKLHDAAGRQGGFAYLPALQLAPIVDRRTQRHGRRLDFARGFTVEDTDRRRSGPLRDLLAGNKGAADETLSEMIVDVTEDRRLREFANAPEHAVFLLRNA